MSNSSSKGYQSLLDPPRSVLPADESTPTQPIPDSVPEDVKHLLQKFPSILRTGDMMPTPTLGVEHHIHTGRHPQCLKKPITWIWKNLRFQKQNSHISNLPVLFAVQNHHGPLLCTQCPKKMDPGHLVAIIGVSTRTSTLCQTCRTFQTVCMVATFFQNQSFQRLSPNPCCSRRHPKYSNFHAIWLV